MKIILIKILKRFRLLKYLNLKVSISCNCKSVEIPIVQEIGFSNLYLSEPWMTKLLQIILPIDERLFIDVGVNIGQTLIKLRSVSEKIEYIGFEPNSKCISYVDKLIRINNIKKTTLLPIGVSDQTSLGVLNFFYESKTDSSASMIREFRPEQEINRKEYIPLFDIKNIQDTINLSAISILKIDVEGAELEVLKSFRQLIEEKHPIILIEILPAYNDQNSFRIERQNEIQKLFLELNYSMFRVIKRNEILLDLQEIKSIEIHGDLNKCEYVMVPSNKKNQFEINIKRIKINENL
jgi:FkbM family methyltransferase